MTQSNRFPVLQMIVLGAAAAVIVLLLVIVERVGAPATLLRALGLALVVALVIASSALGATMRPSLFFVCGRQAGAITSAIAATALLLCLFGTAQDTGAARIGGLLLPCGVALAIAASATGPMLRRSGAFTFVDFIRFRFQSRLTLLMTAAVASALLGVAIIAGARLAVEALDGLPGLPRSLIAPLIVLLTLVPILPGGWNSIRPALVAVALCIVAGFAAPASLIGLRLGLGQDHAVVDGLRAASLAVTALQPGSAGIVSALGVTLQTIAVLLVSGLHQIASGRASIARGGALTVLLLCFAAMLPSLGVFPTGMASAGLFGAAKALALPDIFVLLLALVPMLVGLVALVVTAFALAAMLGHGIVYGLVAPRSVSSARLATVRLIAIVAIAVAVAVQDRIDVAFALQTMLVVASATLLPVFLMALLPQAGGVTATLTLLGGLATSVLMIVVRTGAPAEVSLYGFAGAICMGCAGLASCPATPDERASARRLAQPGPALPILDRGV